MFLYARLYYSERLNKDVDTKSLIDMTRVIAEAILRKLRRNIVLGASEPSTVLQIISVSGSGHTAFHWLRIHVSTASAPPLVFMTESSLYTDGNRVRK